MRSVGWCLIRTGDRSVRQVWARGLYGDSQAHQLAMMAYNALPLNARTEMMVAQLFISAEAAKELLSTKRDE